MKECSLLRVCGSDHRAVHPMPSYATQQILRSDQRRKIPRSAITPAGNRAPKPLPNITFANTSPNIRIGKTPSNLNTPSGNNLQVESEYFSLNTRSDIPLTTRSLSICSEDISPTKISPSIQSGDIPQTKISPIIQSGDIPPTKRSLSILSVDVLPHRRSPSIGSVDAPPSRRSPSIWPEYILPYNSSPSIRSVDILPYNSSPSIRSVDVPPTRRSPSIWSEDILPYNSSPSIRSGDITPIRTSPNTLPSHRSLRIPTCTISLRSPNSDATSENTTANPAVLPAVFVTLPLRVNSPAPQSKSFKDSASNGQREISTNTPNRRSAFPNVESSSTSKDASTENILLSLLSQKASKVSKPPATKNSLNKLEDCEQNNSGTERRSPSANSVRYISQILVQTGKSW